MSKCFRVVSTLLLMVAAAYAEEQPLSPDVRAIPGETPTPWLKYQNPAATSVSSPARGTAGAAATAWRSRTGSGRSTRARSRRRSASTSSSSSSTSEWEKGDNRALYINGEGLLEKPSDIDLQRGHRRARRDPWSGSGAACATAARFEGRLVPDDAIPSRVSLSGPRGRPACRATSSPAASITFVFDENDYGLTLAPTERVTVAGNFTGWDGSGGSGRWSSATTATTASGS